MRLFEKNQKKVGNHHLEVARFRCVLHPDRLLKQTLEPSHPIPSRREMEGEIGNNVPYCLERDTQNTRNNELGQRNTPQYFQKGVSPFEQGLAMF